MIHTVMVINLIMHTGTQNSHLHILGNVLSLDVKWRCSRRLR